MAFLQRIIEDLKFENLPANWNVFNLESFSRSKRLWDYQQEAVKNAIKVLWKYYEDFGDYQKNERLEINQERKRRFFKWYRDNGLEEDLALSVDKRKRNIYNLLTSYYPQEKDNKISYEHLINRMGFWMATGSGKTLVIIKLVQVLKGLMERGAIPPYDILFLTHRDDLIRQLKRHIDEFNYANDEIYINLKELKEYANVKRQPTLFKEREITVFYYRSDNLSDEQFEKIIDFKNYDNDGRWYIFLDEAHKGDKEESKRQHIYSILSRNGFLFNFSATFIDPRDIITTAFNFNLERFICSGYGKHISILKQEIRAFRDDEDYTGEEKQKIVLKSLILLTYVKKFYEEIVKLEQGLYHSPLLLTLVNSVNTEDADLKLFFRELEKIGKGDIDKGVFKSALDELWNELKGEPAFMFEDGNKIKIDGAIFKSITKEDILHYVYNSKTSGEIEILIRPSNKQELAFKLKTSDRPFALIKIGDISGWLKNEFVGYEVNERFEDESYFENLNREDSDINILMGSRAFYEGWDSNRPNVINYINIGTGEDARKFILQSVGRGVRIEPVKNKRKRLLSLYNAKEIDEDLFNKIKDKVLPIETLFVFGTNRKALVTVIQELEKEKESEAQIQLSINEEVQKYKLLVPTYKQATEPNLKDKIPLEFQISEEDFKILNEFIKFISDDRIFLMKYNTEPIKIRLLKENLKQMIKFSEKSIKNVDLLIQRIFDYFGIVPEEFDKLDELGERIKHFKNIKVYLKDIKELEEKIERVKNYKDYASRKKELERLFKEGKISFEDLEREIKGTTATEDFEYQHKKIKIKYVANHYYIPLVLSEEEKIDYIKHIIKTQSEVKFINDLEKYLTKSDNKLKEFDWWFFSKLDESLDEVYIPYYNPYNPNTNRYSKYHPDFIFWLKKGNNYFITFVDPKGIQHIDWTHKIDYGYRRLFEEDGKEKIFNHNEFKVKIILLLRTDEVSKVPPPYKRYWFNDIGEIVERILA